MGKSRRKLYGSSLRAVNIGSPTIARRSDLVASVASGCTFSEIREGRATYPRGHRCKSAAGIRFRGKLNLTDHKSTRGVRSDCKVQCTCLTWERVSGGRPAPTLRRVYCIYSVRVDTRNLRGRPGNQCLPNIAGGNRNKQKRHAKLRRPNTSKNITGRATKE